MRRYANLNGDSGVVAYEIAADRISVKFRDGWIYDYTHAEPGPADVEEMKKLAVAGRGLSTYISRHVRERHAAKRQ